MSRQWKHNVAQLTVTLSANAGVSLEFGGHRIWVDALHTQKAPGFSCVDKQLQGRMLQSPAFAQPELILYTHCHPDHFSKELTQAARQLYPNAKLLLPEQQFADQIRITGHRYIYRHGDLELTFLRLPHEGAQYADVSHYGLILSWQEKHILLPGDCETASPVLAQEVRDLPIDAAILNFPWLTLKKGREFVRSVLRPKHWLVCHLPFEADDVNGYRRSTHAAAENVHILEEPLQTVTIEI